MPTLVFLSHSSKDDDKVTRIHDEIEAATSEDVWVDHKDIKVGDHWQPLIDTTLAKSTHMLVIISKHSMGEEKDATDEKARGSREVEAEWRDALLRNKPLLPVVIDDIKLEDIPARLRIIQPVNLTSDWDGGIRQLVDVIGRAHKGASIATDFGHWAVTGIIDRMLTSIPISGREADLAKVQDDLKRAPTSILGVGGLGKSRLAAEIVLTQGDTSGAVWHVCSDYSTAEDVYELLREHLGLEATTPTKEVLKRLRTERLLVVLDNAESVGESDTRRKDYVKLVNDLYDTRSTQVLLTSRAEWADIRAGCVLRLKEPQAAAAEQIVRDMAKVFDISDYKPEDYAAELAEAARYHPRLIEWAVGKLAKFDPQKVIRELRELKGKDLQAKLEEMIRQTVKQMTAAEGDKPEAALRRLVVCRGGCTYEAAGVITQPPPQPSPASEGGSQEWDEETLDEVLEALMEWQFVRKVVTEKGQTRYTIEPLVIAAVSADETAYQAHFDYYQALAWRHDDKQDYVGLEAEADNLEVAFEWANRVEATKAYWLINSCIDFLINRGRFEQLTIWLQRTNSNLENHHDINTRIAAQSSLAKAYQERPNGNRQENLSQAISLYLGTLTYYTVDTLPQEYAMTQNNLGNAYRDLSKVSDREGNLKRAIAAFEAALVYRTVEAAPLNYAATQNNLGIVYRDLAETEDRENNLKLAVTAYEAALVYRTVEAAPLDYAGTQNNLGVAYRNLAQVRDREVNLKRAVAAYKAALAYRTVETAPLAYAQTQRNLGYAYRDLGDLKQAIACWHEAEIYYRQMGVIDDANLMLKWIADGERRL